jgi:hypothetical protein
LKKSAVDYKFICKDLQETRRLLMRPIERIVDYIALSSSPEMTSSPSPNEWDDLVVMAIALGLAPLLYRRLAQTGVSVPPLALAKLAVTHKAHARRNEEIGQQLAEILAACAAQEVDVLVLKGALLAPVIYEEPALRPMNDIDLLFRPEALAKAAAVLESLGYIGKYKDPDQGPGVTKHVSTYRRSGNEATTPNPYLSAGGDRMVEPHTSLEESWFGLKVDITPGIWDRAVPIELHGQPAYRLSVADMLLHLAVHAAFHVIMGASVFVQLHDIGQLLRVWRADLDWSHFMTLVRTARAQSFVYAALYWANDLYKLSLSNEWLQPLARECPPRLVAYVNALDATGLLQRTQQPPLATLGQRLRRGLLDRQETARWANSLAEKWNVWQTAFAFHKTDTVQLLKRRFKATA